MPLHTKDLQEEKAVLTKCINNCWCKNYNIQCQSYTKKETLIKNVGAELQESEISLFKTSYMSSLFFLSASSRHGGSES